MATPSSILVWRIPWTREDWEATVHGVVRVGHDLATAQQRQQSIYYVLSWAGKNSCLYVDYRLMEEVSVREEKIFLCFSEFLAETPVIKDRLTRENHF